MRNIITAPFQYAARVVRSFRNYAFSNSFLARVSRPVYNDWSVRNAVKDGYKVNGWVYRAVTLTSKAGASVPWGVVDKDENRVETDHHINDLLTFPNPWISRQETFELWISWLELCGNATSLKVQASDLENSDNRRITTELWPVSPDRIHPVTSTKVDEWIKGYALDRGTNPKWKPEEILHFKYLDPADPYWGIGPLQAAGKTVDIDTEQKDWNKSAMENQGVLSGVFTFKREFADQSDADAVAEKLNERYAGPNNAKRIGAVGSEAKYQRISATPAEMDFGGSRKDNRNEIFVIFGIPPQYAGALEASTYNNYATSELIFWFQKVIPLLDDLKDTMNFSFKDELGEGEKVTYFLDGVDAIRRAWSERAKVAKTLFEMGVPFDRLNKVFKLGIDEFDGWDVSYPGGKPTQTEEIVLGTRTEEPGEPEDRRAAPSPFRERREEDGEAYAEKADAWAMKHAEQIEGLLDAQKRIVFSALDEAADEFGRVQEIRVSELLADTWTEDWVPVYNAIARGWAQIAADAILIEERQLEAEIQDAVEAYLEDEGAVLRELGHIEAGTVTAITEQVTNAMVEGLTVTQLQTAIIDAGILEPARALRLSRTITGTAGSMGQWMSANKSGATHKTWITAGDDEVRDSHEARAGETVGINATFSRGDSLVGPRYPLDPNMSAGDRVNCRCSMSFSRQT